MMTRSGGILALLMALPLAAQAPAPVTPEAFAWQWPIDVAGTDGAVRFALTPEIYARISRDDLSDLVAFNAAGEAIPLGPAAQAFDRLVPPPAPTPEHVALFRVPREAAGASGDRIALHIGRAVDGTLTRLDAEVTPSGVSSDASAHDMLLDMTALKAPVTRLLLEPAPDAVGSLNARLELAGSDDLANWTTLGSNLALVALNENGLSLQRTQIEMSPTSLPYLRLRRTDSEADLPVVAVRALPLRRAEAMRVVPERQSVSLQGRAVADAPGVFDYLGGGPLPVERVAIILADRNAVAAVRLQTRSNADATWQERARSTAFRLGDSNDSLDSPPIELATLRDRHWRLHTDPPQTRAPTLTLHWRPDQFVLLTQGDAPYRLAAGSRDARRPAYPMRTVLSHLQSRHGDLWLPPQAQIGAGAPLSGDAALTAPPPPPPYKQWVLWGVLLLGAAVIVGMVLKLLRGQSETH